MPAAKPAQVQRAQPGERRWTACSSRWRRLWRWPLVLARQLPRHRPRRL